MFNPKLPSPIGGNNSDLDEEDDFMNLCTKRPHEDDNYRNNATSNKMPSNESSIYRSVTADDDNTVPFDDGNADFSTSILTGNLSASNSNQVKHSATPTCFVPTTVATTKQEWSAESNAQILGPIQMQMPTAGLSQQTFGRLPTVANPQQTLVAPTPLMPITSPLLKQTNPKTTEVAKVKQVDQAAPEQTFVERWTCDVCKSCSFETFEQANSHETSCRILYDAKKKMDQDGSTFPWEENAQQQKKKETSSRKRKKAIEEHKDKVSDTVGKLTNLALTSALSSNIQSMMSATRPTRHPNLALIPCAERSNVLSEYNNLLVRNIEFFYPAASHLDYDNLSGSMNGTLMSKNRLGLRCIHCKESPNHVTAAAFFPRTIGSIASGLGTIGTRHFGWGKCPFVGPDLVEQMVETKKTSSTETRARGRLGLDAYCKDFASKSGIYDDQLSGICWEEGSMPTNADAAPFPLLPSSDVDMDTDRNAAAALLASMKTSTNIEMRSFVPSTIEHFWECTGCRTVPLDFRAKGSVVFSVNEPTNDQVARHLQICGENKPLIIPHNATIEPFYGEQVPPIKVTWDKVAMPKAASSGRNSRRNSSNVSVKTGIEDCQLCFDEDKEFTTDFAFFTVTQLKKCYLTKAGGSRGSCPLGYPGLACAHCAGTETERRFFYTSADHLRNSFSHIPAHINECSLCPQEVKTRLDELKSNRSSQKSLLKVGHHKIFIDRVWKRLHGEGRGVIFHEEEPEEHTDMTATSNEGERIATRMYTSSQQEDDAVDALVVDEEKHLTTDLIFYTLQQLEPYKTRQQKNEEQGQEQEEEREIGFPVREREAFDLSTFVGENSTLPLHFLHQLQGLACRHCKNKSDGRKFFTTSSEHLGELLLTIANHVGICRDCPVSVRTQIVSHQFSHEAQIETKATSHHSYMEEVWRRLVLLSKRKEKPPSSKPSARPFRVSQGTIYPVIDPNTQLVSAEDEQLVTPFTFCVMSQVRPCNLDLKGNGSRSNFDHGFPGLECIHCAGPNSRKFFYRSAEILAGNYAHIPNHLLSCREVPDKLKKSLVELKERHQTQKHHLDRGAQKSFFQNIWNALHNQGRDEAAKDVVATIECNHMVEV